MKQLISKLLCAGFLVLLSGGIYAQTDVLYVDIDKVGMWAKELSPQLEKVLPKLQKINPVTDADKKEKARFLKAARLAKEIIAKGARLSVADAKKYDAWFRLALSESLDECLAANPGSECCFAREYNNRGWGQLWYRAKCFTIRFPGLD